MKSQDLVCGIDVSKDTLDIYYNDIAGKEYYLKMRNDGGMIGVDANGSGALIFNSEGMYRGFFSSDGRRAVAIYKSSLL